MNKTSVVLIAAIASCGAFAKTIDLNGDWNFSKDGAPETVVRVPHDWSIGADFDETKDEGSGMLPWKGEGRYSRSFTLSKEDAETLKSGGEAYIEFDGVMAQPAVIVNGVWVGGTTYGYLSFSKRIGIHLKEGENKLEVVANTHPHWSRWYPGGGIYRDVRLRVLPKGHVVPGSVWIRTPEVTKERAKVVATWRNDDGSEGKREFDVKNPVMWDVENPYLYKLEIGGETYRYGIRTFKWTADDGFHLNGRRLQLKGVCLHSDLGLLGMAFSKDAARRQLKIMRDMGVNAIRTSHNCPDPKFLDLCDEMGFVVWDECFDKWDGTASWDAGRGDLHEYLAMNLRSFVRRDRNHPCVVLWSIGNEITGQRPDFYAGVERRRVRELRDVVRAEDPTRPVAMAACEDQTCEALEDLDVVGWNYARRYKRMRGMFPKMPIVYSESGSSLSDYGFYGAGKPADGRTTYDTKDYRTDGYDFNSAPYSDIADVEFYRVEKERFLAGEFVWTGIDYIGEPSPWFRNWGGSTIESVARSSSFGTVDLTGFPKDRFWLYRSHWNKKDETVHPAALELGRTRDERHRHGVHVWGFGGAVPQRQVARTPREGDGRRLSARLERGHEGSVVLSHLQALSPHLGRRQICPRRAQGSRIPRRKEDRRGFREDGGRLRCRDRDARSVFGRERRVRVLPSCGGRREGRAVSVGGRRGRDIRLGRGRARGGGQRESARPQGLRVEAAEAILRTRHGRSASYRPRRNQGEGRPLPIERDCRDSRIIPLGDGGGKCAFGTIGA